MPSQRIIPDIIHRKFLERWSYLFSFDSQSHNIQKTNANVRTLVDCFVLVCNSSTTQIHDFTTNTTTHNVSFDLLRGRPIPRSQRRVPYILMWNLCEFTILHDLYLLLTVNNCFSSDAVELQLSLFSVEFNQSHFANERYCTKFR